MKINQLPIIVFFLFSCLNLVAQDFRMGKVSVAELEQKVHPTDSAATAAILYKKGKSSIEYDQTDGFITLTEVETRIKIYKKEAYDFANQEVWYYSGNSNREKVFFSDAATFNLVAGKIEKTKLKSDGTFDEVVNKNRSRKKITMPNVKEGSVIEFKYTIRSLFREIRDWNFQMSIPVNYSEFSTFIPEYYVFNARQKGYVSPKVTREKKTKSITFLNKERSSNAATTFTNNKHDYFENQTTYIAENFPAMKEDF